MRALKPLFWFVVLSLAACDAPATAPPATPPVPDQPAPRPVPDNSAPHWSIDARPRALVYLSGAGRPMIDLSCPGPGTMLRVAVPGFSKIESEDRLTLGAGNEAFAFAADLAAPGPGIVASGPIPVDLIDRIELGQPLSAAYGVQRLDPVPGPPPAVARDFIAACRARSAGAA